MKKEVIVYYKPGNEPMYCKKLMANAFNKLNSIFPDKVVKNVNSVDNELGKALCTCYQILGYPNLDSFLSFYGYTTSDSWKDEYLLNFQDNSGKEFVIKYVPGHEPQRLKTRVDNLIKKIETSYPNQIVSRLQTEHKKWYEAASDLRKILGYQSVEEFLKAYGFGYEIAGNIIYKDQELLDVIETIKRRYNNKEKEESVESLFEHNKDLEEFKPFLINRANKLFSKPLGQYLKEIDIVVDNHIKDEDLISVIEELSSRYPKGSSYVKTTSLFKENPDLEKYEDELKKRSVDLWGEKLLPHLRAIGLLDYSSELKRNSIAQLYKKIFIFNDSKTQIEEYIGKSANVTIPSFVKRIRPNAFLGKNIYRVEFEENSECTNVDKLAFKDCKYLKEFDCRSCVDLKIDGTAFQGCRDVKIITK